jgi:sugar O-acyltransferase (sialic acid O-acetyltransferase NeuD family)
MFGGNSLKLFGLYGAGGFGQEVMPIVKSSMGSSSIASSDECVFVETNPTLSAVNGIKIISEWDFVRLSGELSFNIAIADSKLRAEFSTRLIEMGIKSKSIFAPSAKIYESSSIEEGGIFMDFTLVSSNSIIGKFFHLNYFSYVAHDCVIGDFVTFAPSVACNGNVIIGDHVYVGAGAVIKPGTKDNPRLIGKGATIGMGAVVIKDVPPFTTVVGNPARNLYS